MLPLIHAGDVLLPILYGLSLGAYLQYFLSKSRSIALWASALLLSSMLLHVLFLGLKWIHFRFFPVATVYASLSLVALTVACIYYGVERTVREGRTGVFFLVIVFLFQLVSSLLIRYGGPHNPLLDDPNFSIHTIFTLLGIAALAVAAVYGLMYVMLSKQIKSHRFGAIYDALPSLEILETMGRRATAFGILLLGIGLLLGHFWAWKMLGQVYLLDSKIILTDLAWLAYLAGWILMKRRHLYGLRMGLVSLWGFVIFMLILVAVNLLGSTFHHFI